MSIERRYFGFYSSFNRIIEGLRKEYEELFEEVAPELPLKPVPRERYMDESLGKDFAVRIEREIREYGLEAVALYIPFHFTRNWGIYVIIEGLNGLSYLISQRLNLRFDYAFSCCERAVIEHESSHFQVEYSATIAETILRRALYLPYREESKPFNKDEEAIANATMLTSRSPSVRRVRQELQRLCDISPPGYRDYPRYLYNRALLNYEGVKRFLSQTFLGKDEAIPFPTRIEMPGSYRLISTQHISLTEVPESIDALYFIYANHRTEGVLKKLRRLYKGEIEDIEEGIGREPYHIRLKSGQRISVPYHRREGGYILVKIVNEFADAIGKDRKEVRELVRRDP